MRAAAPRARSLPASVYGLGAQARVHLIRMQTISPRRRNPAYEVGPLFPLIKALQMPPPEHKTCTRIKAGITSRSWLEH
jgi:hypothetical protein